MKARALVAGIVLILIASGSAFPWEDETYEQICIDALEFCPDELKTLLNENIFELRKGVLLPKNLFNDFENHFYIVSSGRGEAHIKIGSEFSQLKQILSQPEFARPRIARNFGIAACYVSNICEFPNVFEVGRQFQNRFERSLSLTSKPPVLYDGFDPVKDPVEFAVALARKAERETSPAFCYNLAVNAVADFWIDAWLKSGHSASSRLGPGKLLRFENAVLEDPDFIAIIEQAGTDRYIWADENKRIMIEDLYNELFEEWNRIYDQTGSLLPSTAE